MRKTGVRADGGWWGRARANAAYGGNLAALARALGSSPQRFNLLVHGTSRLPGPALRDAIFRELGIIQARPMALAGELDADDRALLPDGSPEPGRIVTLLRDPRLAPADLAAVEAAGC